MTYRLIEGDGLRTSYEDNPAVRVLAVPDGPVSLEIRYQTTPAPVGEAAEFTRLTFESVFEYRWVGFDQSYWPFHPHDFEFALIEIVRSQWIEAMLTAGTYGDRPPGGRFGGVIHEDRLRHYRIGFDDYGTFDVICLRLRVERETGPSGPA